MPDTATLIIDDKKIELPIIVGSENERGIDISKLRGETGHITLDPGYGNTGSCQSAITFIDGEKGILRYRGIPIEQFEDKPNFVEVGLAADLRPPAEPRTNTASSRTISTQHANLHEGMKHHFEGFPRAAPPMAILSAMINALSCFHPEFLELEDEDHLQDAAARLISKVRTIAAYAYRQSQGLPHIYPDPNLRYVGNFLHMMFSLPYEQY